MSSFSTRIWIEDDGDMLTWDFSIDPNGVVTVYDEDAPGGSWESDPNDEDAPSRVVLMRGTGIMDKYGREIFEGDFINEGDDNVSAVRFINNENQFVGFQLEERRHDGDRWHDLYNSTLFLMETVVLGNVFHDQGLFFTGLDEAMVKIRQMEECL